MMKFVRFPWEQIFTRGFHLIKTKDSIILNLQEYCKESVKKVGRIDWRSKAPHYCVIIAQVHFNEIGFIKCYGRCILMIIQYFLWIC